MAKMISTTCAWCGDIELPAEAARLEIPVRAGTDTTIDFTCPGCGRGARQQVPRRAAMLLLDAGVQVAVGAPGQGSDTLGRQR